MRKNLNFYEIVAGADHSRAMESETIQKNGASPESLTSRGNFIVRGGMKTITFILLMLLAFGVTFTSCKKEIKNENGKEKEDVSIEQKNKDFETYSEIIDKIFAAGNLTREKFLEKVAEIEQLESVEKMYVNESDCNIKVVNGPAFIYVFNELPSFFEEEPLDGGAKNMLTQNKASTNARIAIFNLNSNDKDRKFQNALVLNTASTLTNAGCTVDYFPEEQCSINSYENAIYGNYNAVYFSAHGAYRNDKGCAVILSNEFVETGLFGQNWNTGITDPQIYSEMWHSDNTWVMQPGSGWLNNKSYKAFLVGSLKNNDGGAFKDRLFYFASCEALKTQNPNFYDGFSGSLIGWNDKNVVGEAVGAIMFYRMIMEHESLVGFWDYFYGKTDPETNANLLRKGSKNFKFLSTDTDNPYTGNSKITQPLNGQYIKTASSGMVAWTIKGTYNTSHELIDQPYLLITNSKGEELERINLSVKDGKFSKTFYFYKAFGVINFAPVITFGDLFSRTVSIVFSGKFKENFAVEPEDETDDESVVINGVRWATRNLDAGGQFVAKPEDYGALFQWGRRADGHESRTSGTTTTLSDTDTPAHGNFILAPEYPFDWRNPQNNNLWGATKTANDPSPAGWRVPTKEELESLADTDYVTHEWTTENGVKGRRVTDKATGASLFLPAAGYRYYSNGALNGAGTLGYYWSSTPNGSSAYYLYFLSGTFNVYGYYRATGRSVRCVAEQK